MYLRQIDENGNVYIPTDERGLPLYDLGSSTLGINRPFNNNYNPIASNNYDKSENKGNQLNGTFTADIQITDFLKANLTSTIIWGHTNATGYANPFFGSKAGVNGSLSKSSTESWRQNHVQTLTYFDNFGKHGVTVMLGHEYYKIRTEITQQLLNVLDRNYVEEITMKPDFYDCFCSHGNGKCKCSDT